MDASEIPATANVFGYLHSAVGLLPVRDALCSRLGMSAEQIRIKPGSEGEPQTLQIETSTCSLETRPARAQNTWQLNGAVAGSPEEIFETLLPLVQHLGWAGFSTRFEIYDAAFQFAGECPRDAPPADSRQT